MAGAFQGGVPPGAQGRDRFGVMHIDALLQAMPGQGSIHRAGIDMDEPERLGNDFGIGAFAAGAGAVNRYDNSSRCPLSALRGEAGRRPGEGFV